MAMPNRPPFSVARPNPISFSSKVPHFCTNNHFPKPFINPAQVRPISNLAEKTAGLQDMVSGTEWKYYMLCHGWERRCRENKLCSSLAVKFANHAHLTLVVSTDPAHSLSDSFDQDLRGGGLVHINPEKTMEDIRSAMQNDNGANIKKIMDSMGLGMFSKKDQMRALDAIKKDKELASLEIVEAPLFDVDVRGILALKFMGRDLEVTCIVQVLETLGTSLD